MESTEVEKRFPWVTLVVDDIMTYPDPGVIIEAVFEKGAIDPRPVNRWCNHAFCIRREIGNVFLPLYGVSVPLQKVVMWRKSPYVRGGSGSK